MINPDVQRDTAEVLLTGRKCSVDHTLRPEFIRLAPPLHIAEDEVSIAHVSPLSTGTISPHTEDELEMCIYS